MLHHTNREMKPALVLAICAVMGFLTVGAGNAADAPTQDYHITGFSAVIGPCPTGPNWTKFGYDEKSSITFCMNRVPGPPNIGPESLDDLTYTITAIRGYAATGFTCGSQFGTGWNQWGWDGQSHIHFCEQLGNGRESEYLTDAFTQLGNGCTVGTLQIYNGNSNISFCTLSTPLN